MDRSLCLQFQFKSGEQLWELERRRWGDDDDESAEKVKAGRFTANGMALVIVTDRNMLNTYSLHRIVVEN